MVNIAKRKYHRLPHYDYAQDGMYFVTVCVQDRKELLGAITDGTMILNNVGNSVRDCWKTITFNFDNVALDQYCIMPNHIHGIIIIRRGLIHQTHNYGQYKIHQTIPGMINHAPTNWQLMKNPNITLGKIIRFFKGRATRIIRKSHAYDFQWQRSFYEHIIRDDKSLHDIREYINNNPAHWGRDENNMHRVE